ncbi:MAG: UDP-N-acetylmuramate--alanine ligase, partial [Micavibrio aeruginosavorus]
MLPLAVILKGMGHDVSGSDRSYDQGRTPEKFAWISAQGIKLHPQDGSGISSALDEVVISKAVEDTVPDIAAAKAKGIKIITRVEMLVRLFNEGGKRIAIAGTSGKTTTTGMTGYILKEAGLDPTVMNGGIFRNYIYENPYATAFVGQGEIFVSEVDESDGAEAVATYRPDIAVLHNITLDHQPMSELVPMFAGFLSHAKRVVLNADEDAVLEAAGEYAKGALTYSMKGRKADVTASDIAVHPDGVSATIHYNGHEHQLRLHVPGRHNLSNALAALTAACAAGVEMADAVRLLSGFSGIRRRLEVVGNANGITVIDDFAHNPDKIAASLGALHEFSGRVHIFFQPHGYGFLKVVGKELAESFAHNMRAGDR